MPHFDSDKSGTQEHLKKIQNPSRPKRELSQQQMRNIADPDATPTTHQTPPTQKPTPRAHGLGKKQFTDSKAKQHPNRAPALPKPIRRDAPTPSTKPTPHLGPAFIRKSPKINPELLSQKPLHFQDKQPTNFVITQTQPLTIVLFDNAPHFILNIKTLNNQGRKQSLQAALISLGAWAAFQAQNHETPVNDTLEMLFEKLNPASNSKDELKEKAQKIQNNSTLIHLISTKLLPDEIPTLNPAAAQNAKKTIKELIDLSKIDPKKAPPLDPELQKQIDKLKKHLPKKPKSKQNPPSDPNKLLADLIDLISKKLKEDNFHTVSEKAEQYIINLLVQGDPSTIAKFYDNARAWNDIYPDKPLSIPTGPNQSSINPSSTLLTDYIVNKTLAAMPKAVYHPSMPESDIPQIIQDAYQNWFENSELNRQIIALVSQIPIDPNLKLNLNIPTEDAQQELINTLKEKILHSYPKIPQLLNNLHKLLPQNLQEDSLQDPFASPPLKSFLSSKLKGLPPNLSIPHLPNAPKLEDENIDKFAQFDFSNAPQILQIIQNSHIHPNTIQIAFDDIFDNYVKSKKEWINLSMPKTKNPIGPTLTPEKFNQNPTKLSLKSHFHALLK